MAQDNQQEYSIDNGIPFSGSVNDKNVGNNRKYDDKEMEYECMEEYRVPLPKCEYEYLETFQGNSKESGKWIYSYHKEYSQQSWNWGYGFVKPTIECDKSLVMENAAAMYGIATLFDQPVDNKGRDLIVQYEVRFQKGLNCGGAYLKLLRDGGIMSAEELSSDTPYALMFGPDLCGKTDRIHVIIPHYNPSSKRWIEKRLFNGPRPINDTLTHLYTLIIRQDNSIEILVDQINKYTGNLNDDFDPPFSTSRMMADPSETKPKDWVDQERIYDPSDFKPADWDENEPKLIVDELAVKPADWLEDEPLLIPDPNAEVPEDWDEEDYGPFEGKLVPNPRCEEVSGCGVWEKPMIPNPKYRGPYHYRTIPNPKYKGPWLPHFIPNPDYYVEEHPANLPRMNGIAIEVWTMQEGIAFDNIMITHDELCAEQFADATFRIKREKELKEHPEVKRRQTMARTKGEAKIEEESEEEWAGKRRASVSIGVFINNLIDDYMHWDYDEKRCSIVEKATIAAFVILLALCCLIYYRNRDFLKVSKLL